MEVRQGEIYGFLGRNGAGKTSTIRMLMGVVRADSGEIELLDARGTRIGIPQKQRIGYVSQEQNFYPWMTCRGIGRFVSGFYPTWDASEFSRLLLMLDLPGDRKISHLSGGMRVKLALALALAHRPQILILDEPTSGLDPVARREFLEIIRRQSRAHGRTTFFSSHLIDEVERVADRVGIIHRGQLRYEGDVPRLQASVRKVRYAVQHRPGTVTAGATPIAAEPQSVAPSEQAHLEAATGLPAEAAVPVLEAQIFDAQVVRLETAPAGSALEALLVPGQDVSRWPAAPPAGQFTPSAGGMAPAFTSPWNSEARNELAKLATSRGFTVLRDGFDGEPTLILAATPEHWDIAPFPPGDIGQLSLEDIFIAMAAEVTTAL